MLGNIFLHPKSWLVEQSRQSQEPGGEMWNGIEDVLEIVSIIINKQRKKRQSEFNSIALTQLKLTRTHSLTHFSPTCYSKLLPPDGL